jgi:hypothetical protein
MRLRKPVTNPGLAVLEAHGRCRGVPGCPEHGLRGRHSGGSGSGQTPTPLGDISEAPNVSAPCHYFIESIPQLGPVHKVSACDGGNVSGCW